MSKSYSIRFTLIKLEIKIDTKILRHYRIAFFASTIFRQRVYKRSSPFMMQSISSRPQLVTSKTSKFPICIKKYNYKFLEYDTPVFTIKTTKNTGDPKKEHYKDIQYYTAPLIMEDANRSENVLISLMCQTQAKRIQDDLLDTYDIKTGIMGMTLGELSYHASILNTPLVTIINSYCVIDNVEDNKTPSREDTEYEIFYTRKYLEKIKDCEDRDLFGF